MHTVSSLNVRVTTLEQDSSVVHEILETLTTRLNVLEDKVDRGFARIEQRFDNLEAWLRERL